MIFDSNPYLRTVKNILFSQASVVPKKKAEEKILFIFENITQDHKKTIEKGKCINININININSPMYDKQRQRANKVAR